MAEYTYKFLVPVYVTVRLDADPEIVSVNVDDSAEIDPVLLDENELRVTDDEVVHAVKVVLGGSTWPHWEFGW